MPAKTTNNAHGTLAGDINNSVTTINLSSGQGAKFPSLSAGEYFYGTLIAVDNTTEIVKVTARSSDALTVTRAQDNTSASAFSTGDRFELRPTAALFNEFVQKTGDSTIDGSLTVDLITINGNEIDLASGDLIVDAPNDIYLNADGGQVFFQDGSSIIGILSNENSGDFGLVSYAQDKDLILRGNDGGSYINALTLDMSEAGKAIFNAGAEINGGILDIKNDGSQSEVRLYCESNNAHYASLKAPAHADFSGNITLTLPATTGTLISTANSNTPATTTSSGDADFVLVDDGGVMKKITPANLGIGGSGSVTVQDEGSALATEATTFNFVGAGVVASGTGAVKTITISGGGSGGALTDQTWGASLDSDSANESKLWFKNDHYNIVIGTGGTVAEPASSLDETGNAINNIFIGRNAGAAATTAVYSVFIGSFAGENITTGASNTFIGYQAGDAVQTGHSRATFVGYQAGYDAEGTGNENITSVGYQAGYRARNGSTSIGAYAGSNRYYGTGGAYQTTSLGAVAGGNYYSYYRSYDVDVGYYAGYDNRQGDHSIHIGFYADGLSTDVDNCVTIGSGAKVAGNSVSIGYQSQNSGNSGSIDMVSIGYRAGYDMDGGDNAVFIGYQAGYGGGTADNNIAIGRGALYNITSGGSNVCVGYQALNALTEGDHNVTIGHTAGDAITTGSYNVCVGSVSDVITATKEKGIAVGYHADVITQGTAVGYAAHSSAHTSAFGATSIGYNAGNDTRNNYNTYVGWEAGKGSAGDENVGIGKSAIDSMSSSADYNTAVGSNSMNVDGGSVSGSSNSALGYFAGSRLDSGNDNTAVGANAMGGATDLTGSNNTCIGHDAIPSAASVSNEITLGDSNVATLRCQVTSITALSDQRDKTAIEDLDLGLKFINAMKPRKFTWNRRDGKWGGKKEIGFIAQELHEVEMDFSSTERTRLVSHENPSRLEAQPMNTYPILVKAIQELSAKVDSLQAEITKLKGA